MRASLTELGEPPRAIVVEDTDLGRPLGDPGQVERRSRLLNAAVDLLAESDYGVTRRLSGF